MNKKDKEELDNAIENEGFDYALAHYSSWNNIDDKDFQQLKREYRGARKRLMEYLEVED